MTKLTAIARLRTRARLTTLFPPTTLGDALKKLGFIQADPIRAPARAQDLILRHRVSGYRAGDLERSFARLKLEEDFLYAYGFTTRENAALFHPRPDPDCEAGVHAPSGLAGEVLAFVRAHGPTHPADLEKRFGRERAVNGWGGFSKATTRALERLHHFGLLRVARRRDGIRIYEAFTPPLAGVASAVRAHKLVMLVVGLLAPVSVVSLRGALALVTRRNPGLGPLAPVVAAALGTGELEREEVDGQAYLWPTADGGWQHRPVRRDVRLLAPFDPVVWDRRRFEHLWGWSYRFEAYTPPPKRQFGYYALPLLWGDEVIGWANARLAAGKLHVETGYARHRPLSKEFGRALDAELARLERFLIGRSVAGRGCEHVAPGGESPVSRAVGARPRPA